MIANTKLVAAAAAVLVLGMAQSSHAITWRAQYYNLTAARDFGRDHSSFFGTGHNWGCTGALIQQNNRILTAKHCPQGSQWKVRGHGAVGVSSSATHSSTDIRVVKLSANSGGTPVGLYSVTDLNGKTFHKAGYGRYGDIANVGGATWFGAGEPLAGHNTYTAGDTPSVQYVLKTSAYSVGTAPGDSGGPGLVKNSSGAWTVSSTTTGPGNGFYVDARVSTARSWILTQM